MELLIPKYRRNPNERVEAIYSGIGPGGRMVTRVMKPSLDRQRMERTSVDSGPGTPRGQGGRVAVLVIGGMETTLAEMEYLVEAAKEKKFQPRRSSFEVAQMCRLLLERRNDMIRHLRKNPSERPKPRQKVRLHLPIGYRYVPTREPGLNVLAQV